MKRRHLSFHYTLKDERGRLLDTSRGNAAMSCVEGAGQIIEGLEEELLQMTVGEKRSVVVAPEKGYGAYDNELVQKVPQSALPVEEINVGDQFQTEPDRHAPVVTVKAIEGEYVVLDANHPLAGQELHFEVELVSVRAATPEELAQAKSQIVD